MAVMCVHTSDVVMVVGNYKFCVIVMVNLDLYGTGNSCNWATTITT